MMRLVTIAAVGLFLGNLACRAVYIHVTEFVPAQREWEAAHQRGDRDAMFVALHKEQAASRRSFDPLWFVGSDQ